MHTLNCQIMARGAAVALALALIQLSAGRAAAADYKVGSMQINQPWARATPKGATSGAGYMTVTNNGTAVERLSCVASEVAAECQIHSMTMDGGVMKMRPVEGGLEIKPGETVTLKPGGFHVMFVNLKHPLQQDKTLEATFKFENAGTVEIGFPILAIGATAPGATGGDTMKMQGGGGMMPMNKQ